MKPGSVADAVPLIRKLNHHGQVVVRSVQASAESEIPRDESSSEQVPRHVGFSLYVCIDLTCIRNKSCVT